MAVSKLIYYAGTGAPSPLPRPLYLGGKDKQKRTVPGLSLQEQGNAFQPRRPCRVNIDFKASGAGTNVIIWTAPRLNPFAQQGLGSVQLVPGQGDAVTTLDTELDYEAFSNFNWIGLIDGVVQHVSDGLSTGINNNGGKLQLNLGFTGINVGKEYEIHKVTPRQILNVSDGGVFEIVPDEFVWATWGSGLDAPYKAITFETLE